MTPDGQVELGLLVYLSDPFGLASFFFLSFFLSFFEREKSKSFWEAGSHYYLTLGLITS